MNRKFNLLLAGAPGVGKTAFITRHIKNKFDTKYVQTKGIEIYSIVFGSTAGDIDYTIYDYQGNSELDFMNKKFCTQLDCAVVMYSISSRNSFFEMKNIVNNIIKVSKLTPDKILICGTKIDENTINVTKHDLEIYRRAGHICVKISSCNEYNIDIPFLELSKRLLSDESVVHKSKKIINKTIENYLQCDIIDLKNYSLSAHEVNDGISVKIFDKTKGKESKFFI